MLEEGGGLLFRDVMAQWQEKWWLILVEAKINVTKKNHVQRKRETIVFFMFPETVPVGEVVGVLGKFPHEIGVFEADNGYCFPLSLLPAMLQFPRGFASWCNL